MPFCSQRRPNLFPQLTDGGRDSLFHGDRGRSQRSKVFLCNVDGTENLGADRELSPEEKKDKIGSVDNFFRIFGIHEKE